MIFTFNNIPDTKVGAGIKAIQQNGGHLAYRDKEKGIIEFDIKGVEGVFVHSENVLKIEITDKPWLASWDMIEGKLKEFFNK